MTLLKNQNKKSK